MKATRQENNSNLELCLEQPGLPIGKFAVDDAVQAIVFELLLQRISCLPYHLPIAGSHARWKIYDHLPPVYYRLYMARDVYITVAQREGCVEYERQYHSERRLTNISRGLLVICCGVYP